MKPYKGSSYNTQQEVLVGDQHCDMTRYDKAVVSNTQKGSSAHE